MSEQMQKALRDKDLLSALISGAVAAIVMTYVANAAKPGVFQMVLALVAIAAILSAYLFIARSNVDSSYKAGTVTGVGIAGVVLLVLLSKLF